MLKLSSNPLACKVKRFSGSKKSNIRLDCPLRTGVLMVSGINIQKTENEYRSPASPSDETTSAETLRYFLYKFRYFYITLPVNN